MISVPARLWREGGDPVDNFPYK